MTLSDFIKRLQKLESEGNGSLPVYYRHGGSGSCGPLASPRVTNRVDDMGPFDVKGNYISIYAD